MTFQSLLLVPNNSVIIHDTLYKVHIVYYTMHFHTTLCNFPNYLTISIVWRFPVKWDWSIYGAADPSAKCVPCTVYTRCEFIICVYNTVAEPFFSSFHSSHLVPCLHLHPNFIVASLKVTHLVPQTLKIVQILRVISKL